MKNPMTPTGIEPVTFRFVTQHLNHCATAAVPTITHREHKYNSKLIYKGEQALETEDNVLKKGI